MYFSQSNNHSLIEFAVLRHQELFRGVSRYKTQVLQSDDLVEAVYIAVLVGPYDKHFVVRTDVDEIAVIGERRTAEGIGTDTFDLELLCNRADPLNLRNGTGYTRGGLDSGSNLHGDLFRCYDSGDRCRLYLNGLYGFLLGNDVVRSENDDSNSATLGII